MKEGPYLGDLACLQSQAPGLGRPVRKGVRVGVHFLRKNGVKLSAQERKAQEPLIADMIIREANSKHAGVFLAAFLYDPFSAWSVPTGLHKPLINISIVSMDERGLVIRGFEIDVVDDKTVEYAQVWLVKPLPDPSK